MNTCTIETAHGPLIAKGDAFTRAENEVTGEHYGYDITNNGELVAYVAVSSFISVAVTPDPGNDIAVQIDGRELVKSVRKAEAKYRAR